MLTTLSDVTSEHEATIALPLQWVGMEGIAVPVSLHNYQSQAVPGKINVYVSVDKTEAKGIHMSRMHLIINQLAELELSKLTLERLLEELILSQEGISTQAKITLTLDILLRKEALLSGEFGYQSYPVTISAEMASNRRSHQLEITIPYSSTCPCSASLAQQLLSDRVNETFPTPKIDKQNLLHWIESAAGSVATPHSQRSYAYINLSIGDNDWPDISGLIRTMENTIGTPVQTAVKRNDEQEFARLNASNLMFCEDAARRVKNSLESMDFVQRYWFKIEHQESLHAHNATVIDEGENRTPLARSA
ncbi:MAG: GTP cyclohydrolase FolE2 [Immundisolibacteraceae bacterium]|nr:GTP cyclohydrolase FolE2 [Immundisolibacteraceae bacterium]